jgi:RHS repeat-associated protein
LGTFEYVYDAAGRAVGQWDVNAAAWTRIEVYANGEHLATYAGGINGATYFAHSDWLGTERARSDVTGNLSDSFTSLPFGESLSAIGASPVHFTGQERDAESNLDHFWFRQYSSTLARWMTPDPAGLGAVDPSNPQSWNRYAYAGNNPTSFVDPLGLTYAMDACNEGGCGGGGFDLPFGGWFWSMVASFQQTSADGYQFTNNSFQAASGFEMARSLYNFEFSKRTGGFLPSQCRTGADGQTWCGSGDWEYGDWTAVGNVNINISTLFFGAGPGQRPPPTSPNAANNGTPTTPVVQKDNGKSIPNVPPEWGFCSGYRDGSGAGDAMYHLCMSFPNGPWSNCVRGKLLNQWTPNPNPFQLVWYLGPDHTYDFATCAAGKP